MEEQNLALAKYPNISSISSKNSAKKAAPFEHIDLKNSLEDIVSNTAEKQKCNPLEDMLSDKTKTLKSSVNALLEEIRLRKELNTHQFKKMNNEICKQHTELMQLDNLKDIYPFDLTSDLDEAKDRIKSNVLELEKEKRAEKLECWKDLMFLKKYLMVSLKDYWELVRKRRMLKKS